MTESEVSATTSVQITPLNTQHHADWQRLYLAYAAFYDVPMNDDIAATTWGWLLDPDHDEQGLVALVDGAVVGLAHFRRFPKPLQGRDAGFLDDLFVDPSYRGEGVGRQLIEAVAAIGRQHSWSMLRWVTKDDNYPARSLYDQLATRTDWVTYDLGL